MTEAKMRRAASLLVIILLIASAVGCSSTRGAKEAGIGGLIGAGAGFALGGVEGAIDGALAGGALGYAYGVSRAHYGYGRGNLGKSIGGHKRVATMISAQEDYLRRHRDVIRRAFPDDRSFIVVIDDDVQRALRRSRVDGEMILGHLEDALHNAGLQFQWPATGPRVRRRDHLPDTARWIVVAVVVPIDRIREEPFLWFVEAEIERWTVAVEFRLFNSWTERQVLVGASGYAWEEYPSEIGAFNRSRNRRVNPLYLSGKVAANFAAMDFQKKVRKYAGEYGLD